MNKITINNYKSFIINYINKNESYGFKDFYSSIYFIIKNNDVLLFQKVISCDSFNINFEDHFILKEIIKFGSTEMLRTVLEYYGYTNSIKNIFSLLTSIVISSNNLEMLKLMYKEGDLYYKFLDYGSVYNLRHIFIKNYNEDMMDYVF